jgi:N-sulfoglucosamine sulfohydrolase
MQSDREERNNLATNIDYRTIFDKLKFDLHNWMNISGDPWLCAPSSIVEYEPPNINQPKCYPLYNDFD